jgi:plastocyanin
LALLVCEVSQVLPREVVQQLTTVANLQARQAKVIPVVVGGPQDTFNPNSVTAAVGDIVQFQFSNGNHTATQSTLEAPCTPLGGGVNSGHIPFSDGMLHFGPIWTCPLFVAEKTFPHHADIALGLGQTTVGTFSMVVSTADPIFMFWFVTSPTEITVMTSQTNTAKFHGSALSRRTGHDHQPKYHATDP